MGGCPSADAAATPNMPHVSAFQQKPKAPEREKTKAEAIEKGAGLNNNQQRGGAYREFNSNMDSKLLLEHYQPPEFPPVPVIGRETHELTNQSWKLISSREYDDPDSPSGKVKGSVYFYNTFFRMLFDRSTDFKSKFPTVQSQASVMSKVMSLCLSIEFDKLDLQRMQLEDLGRKHQYIVQDPWQYAIYATTLHSALKICLGDDASPQLMTAWLHVFSFVLRTMLPLAITPLHIRIYAGAVNATTMINEDDQQTIKNQSEYKSMKSDLVGLQPSAAKRRAADRAAIMAEANSRLAAANALEASLTTKQHAAMLNVPEGALYATDLDDVTDAKEFNEKVAERAGQNGTAGTAGNAPTVTLRMSGVGNGGPTAAGSGRGDSPKLKPGSTRVNSISAGQQPGGGLLGVGGGPAAGTGATTGARANAYRAVHTPTQTPGAGPQAVVAATTPN